MSVLNKTYALKSIFKSIFLVVFKFAFIYVCLLFPPEGNDHIPKDNEMEAIVLI